MLTTRRRRLRDYLSGRTPELDALLFWAEPQATEITRAGDYGGCLDCATPDMVSHQLWALLVGLVKGDASGKRTFANVPRHNGVAAFCRIAEPVNEQNAIVRKDLLSMDNLQAALEV